MVSQAPGIQESSSLCEQLLGEHMSTGRVARAMTGEAQGPCGLRAGP